MAPVPDPAVLAIEQGPMQTAWKAGLTVGRYTLMGKLAMGGMAEIWLARQAGPRGFEKVIVIKKILDSYTSDDGFVEMFLDEARTAAQLNHPNVVQIFDLGEHERSYFIAMGYLAGETVARVARTGAKEKAPLPYTFAARIVAEGAAGLGYAHAKKGLDGQPLNMHHADGHAAPEPEIRGDDPIAGERSVQCADLGEEQTCGEREARSKAENRPMMCVAYRYVRSTHFQS